MRVLHLVHGYPPECSGGTETYLPQLVAEQVGLGHEVQVVCGTHEGRSRVTVESFAHEGVTVHKLFRSGLFVDSWDKSRAPEIEPALELVLAGFRPDLIHVHQWIRLSRHLIEFFDEREVPGVCTLHDLWTTCPRIFRIREGGFCSLPVGAVSCLDCAPKALEADADETAEGLDLFRDDFANELALARRIIVPSKGHGDAVVAHHPGIADRLRTVPFGGARTVRPRTRPVVRDPARVRFGHWGNLSALKGIDLLLDAVKAIPDALSDRWELHVFGPFVYPEEEARIRPVLEQMRQVRCHGIFTHRELEAQPLDVAVIPTRCSESYSYVLDEAFLLGLPAIVPRRGALGERLHGAGRTFEPECAQDLTKTLVDVILAPDALVAWQAKIPALLSPIEHARGVLAVYEEALRAPRPSGTPLGLKSRRARFESRRVERRNRLLEFLRGDLKNLQADLSKADATLAEMDFHHREKDKVISYLQKRLDGRTPSGPHPKGTPPA